MNTKIQQVSNGKVNYANDVKSYEPIRVEHVVLGKRRYRCEDSRRNRLKNRQD